VLTWSGLYAGEVEEVGVEYLIEIHETQAAYLYILLSSCLAVCMKSSLRSERESPSYVCFHSDRASLDLIAKFPLYTIAKCFDSLDNFLLKRFTEPQVRAYRPLSVPLRRAVPGLRNPYRLPRCVDSNLCNIRCSISYFASVLNISLAFRAQDATWRRLLP